METSAFRHLATWPEAVRIELPAHTKRHVYATRLFLMTALQSLYSSLSALQVRRDLFAVFSVAVLAAARQRCLPDVTSWANCVLALPQPGVRLLALRGFSRFVQTAVFAMKKRQAIYNMCGVRGDALRLGLSCADPTEPGHFETPFTAIQAWGGLDGSLLKTWVLCSGEAFQTQAADLKPYLEFGRDVRQGYGLSPIMACSVRSSVAKPITSGCEHSAGLPNRDGQRLRSRSRPYFDHRRPTARLHQFETRAVQS